MVLNLATTALDAARAIEKNNIGAVVAQEQGRAVGIVTDRDLTIRVVGQGLDPKATPISEVMTAPVMALAPADVEHLRYAILSVLARCSDRVSQE